MSDVQGMFESMSAATGRVSQNAFTVPSAEGEGASEDGTVSAKVAGGKLVELRIDTHTMRRGNAEVADLVIATVNAAIEAHATALMSSLQASDTDFGKLQFSPTPWVTNGHKLSAAGDDLGSASQSFISSVSDVSVFGGSDLVGSVAAMIYGLMVERMGGCLDTLAEGKTAHGSMVTQAGETYADLEASQVDRATSIEGML